MEPALGPSRRRASFVALILGVNGYDELTVNHVLSIS